MMLGSDCCPWVTGSYSRVAVGINGNPFRFGIMSRVGYSIGFTAASGLKVGSLASQALSFDSQ